MKKGLLIALFVAASVFPATAFADVQGSTNNNTDISIPDASVVGVPVSASTITIMQNEIIEEATFTIEGLAHTYVGDLVARVVHEESAASVTLFSRIGKDNPSLGTGDSSNFDGDYDFSDATNNFLWDEAGNGQSGYTLRTKAGDSTNQPNPGVYRAAAGLTGAPISINNAFAGLSTQGTWRLELSDRNGSQVGTFREFGVSFVSSAVPEPSTFAFLFAAGFTGLSMRRRRV